jgi:hypothetical protein
MRAPHRFIACRSILECGVAAAAVLAVTFAADGRGADPSCCECLADIDGDGNVNGADLGLLLAAWDSGGSAENDMCEDVNGDGNVDGADLGLLLAAWESCVPNDNPKTCGTYPTCGPIATHDCCTTGDVGCTDEDCCETVCDVDPFCCTTAWDTICVNEAITMCPGLCVPIEDDCNGDAATHDCCTTGGVGCSDEACCKMVCSLDPFCCTSAWDTLCVSIAEAFCGLFCSVCGDAATHDCCTTTGGVGCTDADCCETVCDIDPFCCTVAWDSICVSEAFTMCDVCHDDPWCGDGATHDCCTTGGVGCTDADCCNLVCSVDSFCCTSQWDGFCVLEAEALCGLDCPTPACPNLKHDCVTTGGPGCSDVDCCNMVCDGDSACCSIAWDAFCVSAAVDLCYACDLPPCEGTPEAEPCGGDTNGGCNSLPVGVTSDCCFASGGLGCDDAACTSAVCTVDAFCCTVSWDSICASEAATLCGDLCIGEGFKEEPIACGETICGAAFSLPNLRDTDWYHLTLAADAEVTIDVVAEFPVAVYVGPYGCPEGNLTLATGPCATPVSLTVCLSAGDSWVVVLPAVFFDLPCQATYSVTVHCGEACSP